MMTLTELTTAVNALRTTDSIGRHEQVGAIAPDLHLLASNRSIDEATRINLITKAARSLNSRAPRADTPEAALAVLTEAFQAPRGPGRPAIGPPTTVRMSAEAYAWLDEQARERGLLTRDGQPHRAGAIRAVIDEARRRHG